MRAQINECPHCGESHEQLESRMSNVRFAALTHRFTCPSTGRDMFWGEGMPLIPEQVVAKAALAQ